jgi:hypothetical protein
MNKELTYTDEEGNKLYGYSQTDMDGLKKAVYIVGFAFLTTIILMAAFGFLLIDHFNLIDYVAFKFKRGCL